MKLEREIERWALVEPKAIADSSFAAILFLVSDAKKDIAALASALAAKDAEIERLREALEPFADVAQYILAEAPAEATMWQAYASCDGTVAQISLEYLRRARAALNPESAK